jgi:hypothetical protein
MNPLNPLAEILGSKEAMQELLLKNNPFLTEKAKKNMGVITSMEELARGGANGNATGINSSSNNANGSNANNGSNGSNTTTGNMTGEQSRTQQRVDQVLEKIMENVPTIAAQPPPMNLQQQAMPGMSPQQLMFQMQ